MVRVSADSLVELRKRRSAKWRTFAEDVLPLPVAEMDYPIAKPIRDVLIDMVKRSDTGYSGIAPELPQAFANYAQRNWNWTVNKDQFYLATDVGVAGVEVLRLWTEPGDKVVINTPVYLNFFTWIKEAKCEAVDVPLNHVGDEWSLDLAGLEDAFAAGAKAYILCHPHNPVGHVFTLDELEKIAELAKKYKSRSEFKAENSSAYTRARLNGWLEEVCSHMSLKIHPNEYWTKEKVIASAKQFNTRTAWMRSSDSTAYNLAREKGWMDEACAHMHWISTKPKK